MPLASAARPAGHPHLVDATMFWSAHGGGVGRYLRAKQDWAAAHTDWRHTLYVPGQSAALSGINAPLIPFSGGYRVPWRRSLAAGRLAALQPDLIEVGDPYRLAWAALDAAQRCGVPALAFAHSDPVALATRWLGAGWGVAARSYLHHVYRNFDVILAASRWMVERLSDFGLTNVVHQPLGVDLAQFHPARRARALHATLGVPPSTRLLVYAGRFAAEKNLPLLSAAVDRLGDGHLLLALGAGPLPPQGARVRRLPYRCEPAAIAAVLGAADVFVHAGESETFGLAPLEALACGTPAVLPQQAGLRDLVDGQAALGVPRATPQALAEAVAALLAQDRATLRAQARASAQRFEQDRMFGRLFARYAALRRLARPQDDRRATPRYA
jgi:alpha-1,6-mannosyltransferase